jgi:hypothetical protein
MPRVSLTATVRTLDGRLTTIHELSKQGLIRWERVENWHSRKGNGTRVACFATMPDGGSWEISEYAYEGRIAAQQKRNEAA